MNGLVFSISPSGAVQIHQLKMKGDYRLFTIKVTVGAWIAELTQHLDDGTGNVFSLYAFDPETGVPSREYFFPRDLGYGLACTNGNEFTFVMADIERKSLKLLKLAPATYPNRTDLAAKRDRTESSGVLVHGSIVLVFLILIFLGSATAFFRLSSALGGSLLSTFRIFLVFLRA